MVYTIPQQLSMWSSVKKGCLCKMKQYIQPFERRLAIMELSALCDMDISVNQNETSIFLPDIVNIDELLQRLAYWESIETTDINPTKQVLLEASYYSQMNQNGEMVINRLPNTRILRYGPHDLHEYRGKFFPQLVKSLINISSLPKGSLIVDPFCGSGTTNVAAAAMGMNHLGIDLNPLSVRIATTKVSLLTMNPIDLSESTKIMLYNLDCIPATVKTEDIWDAKILGYLSRWFSDLALVEIANILSYIRSFDNLDLVNFWEICLSNILRSISWQKESDLRVRKEVTEYVEKTAYQLFATECQKQLNLIVPYLMIFNQTTKTIGEIVEGNTALKTFTVPSYEGKCDALITSPPYATALPYLDTDRLSLLVLGLIGKDAMKEKNINMVGNREVTEKQRVELWQLYNDRKHELTPNIRSIIEKIAVVNHNENVGFRRKNLPALLGKYFLDMHDAMLLHASLLKEQAHAYYVVGSNSTYINGEKVIIETDTLLWELALRSGYQQIEMIPMELLHSRDIFKENRGTSESILHLKKD